MGCDIHFTLFARRKSNGKKIDLRFKSYENGTSKDDYLIYFEDNKKCYSKYHHLFNDFIDGRSYFLFGILSGVRSNEYYEESRCRRYVDGALPGFEGIKQPDFHSFTLFKANGLRKLLKKIVRKIVDNEMVENENVINSIHSGDYSCIYSGTEKVNMREVRRYENYIKTDIEEGYWRAENVQTLVERIDEYQKTIKSKIPEIDPNSLEIFVWYDS